MESVFDLKSAKALLEWHAELGISEAISERPINRFESKVEANLGLKTSELKDNPVNIIADNPTDQEVMETANAKAGRSKYGLEFDIRAHVDRENGRIGLYRYLEAVENLDNEPEEERINKINLDDAKQKNKIC